MPCPTQVASAPSPARSGFFAPFHVVGARPSRPSVPAVPVAPAQAASASAATRVYGSSTAPRQARSPSGSGLFEILFGGDGGSITMPEFETPEVPDFASIYSQASQVSELYGQAGRGVIELYREMGDRNRESLERAQEAMIASMGREITPVDLSSWVAAQQGLRSSGRLESSSGGPSGRVIALIALGLAGAGYAVWRARKPRQKVG